MLFAPNMTPLLGDQLGINVALTGTHTKAAVSISITSSLVGDSKNVLFSIGTVDDPMTTNNIMCIIDHG